MCRELSAEIAGHRILRELKREEAAGCTCRTWHTKERRTSTTFFTPKRGTFFLERKKGHSCWKTRIVHDCFARDNCGGRGVSCSSKGQRIPTPPPSPIVKSHSPQPPPPTTSISLPLSLIPQGNQNQNFLFLIPARISRRRRRRRNLIGF